MGDTAVGRYAEDTKSRERSQHTDQRLELHTALSSQDVDGNVAVGRDTIGNTKVGNETKHSGNLKASDKEIKRCSIIIYSGEFLHNNHLSLRSEIQRSSRKEKCDMSGVCEKVKSTAWALFGLGAISDLSP